MVISIVTEQLLKDLVYYPFSMAVIIKINWRTTRFKADPYIYDVSEDK